MLGLILSGLIPWERLEERIRPFYPKAGRGRRPYELSAMLRIHCVQLFYNLRDPGMEDMPYEMTKVTPVDPASVSGTGRGNGQGVAPHHSRPLS